MIKIYRKEAVVQVAVKTGFKIQEHDCCHVQTSERDHRTALPLKTLSM